MREKNKITRVIEEHLRPSFPNVEAKQYNAASIRIRVLDQRFQRMSNLERERLVEPLLDELPPDVVDLITILLLLTPEEAKDSPMNYEFEHPSPSML
jgi:stress-induced morphogen